MINEIDHSITEFSGGITLEFIFPEEFNPINNAADLTVYIPEDLTELNLVLGVGTIKIHDDFTSNLSAKIDTANMYIDKLIGAADIEARMGNVHIFGGFVSAGSRIKTGMGNIGVKADFDESGSYVFETGLGNIKIAAPENRKLVFTNIGDVKVNAFETDKASANIKLKSEMGEISIIKY